MDLLMEAVMMAMLDVKEILYVGAIIARNLDYSITKRMTAVKKGQQQLLQQLHLGSILTHFYSPPLAKDAAAVTMKTEGVVLQKSLVVKEKVIVMGQKRGVTMMAMLDVKEILCVEVTIVESLVPTFMKKMTAVRGLLKVGASGRRGARALQAVGQGGGEEKGGVEERSARTSNSYRRDFATHNHVHFKILSIYRL